ncbi:hypothetical protein A0128_03245 [Leptospira tipperaryensis]|uniref:Uncharacterized protein n=1 Tax=Leptospira tipperaryensis TaxID=2564040 RepID=A0A1D7UTM5_9LEPT|nr:hypothetical protein [Leptospira tipperaryensis]AOP32967.1 hypothetical protein A0128_03245 [Leptospira tipperaryensis]
MFDFFKSKEPSVPVNDQVWISREAKFERCRRLLRKNTSYLFLFWFEESFQEFQSALDQHERPPNIAYANEISFADIQDRFLIFGEHYPLRKKEQDVFLKLQLKEVTVFSSLDEPLFKIFGGENIVDVMKKLRINNEAISHPMINASIHRAQEKIAKKVTQEQKVDSSQKDWFSANLSS